MVNQTVQTCRVNFLKKWSPESHFFGLIASEQGHPDYVEVNMENVKRIVDDKESMEELLNGPLGDLKSELYSIHSSSYNSAYEDDIYRSIWYELQDYVIGPGEWLSKPHPYKKNTEIQSNK